MPEAKQEERGIRRRGIQDGGGNKDARCYDIFMRLALREQEILVEAVLRGMGRGNPFRPRPDRG
jgi:hypothetical protein